MKPHCGKVLILSFKIPISIRLILAFHRRTNILKLVLILIVSFFVEQKLQFFNSVEAITGG